GPARATPRRAAPSAGERSRPWLSSRCESLHGPAVRSPPVTQPVMQPAPASLPEFHGVRRHAEAAPKGRQRHFPARIFFLQVLHRLLECLPVGNDAALGGCPCRQLTRQRPAVEIRLRL